MTLPALPRLRRRRYWLLALLAWLVFFAVRQLAGLDQHPLAGAAWAAVGLGVVGALTVARLHDRNRSGWWLAAVLIPLVGAAWLAWETALRRGTPDANAWGPDPRG
jgi:uncharacterized membrane protein YhaH (DUF805 family)